MEKLVKNIGPDIQPGDEKIIRRLEAGESLRLHLSSAHWGNGRPCSMERIMRLINAGKIVQENDPPNSPFGWAKLTEK